MILISPQHPIDLRADLESEIAIRSVPIVFWALSLGINVLITILIITRLLYYRRRLIALLGASHGSPYTGIIALLVESEILYTTSLLLYIVFFKLNTVPILFFLQVLPPVSVCDYYPTNSTMLITPVMTISGDSRPPERISGRSWQKLEERYARNNRRSRSYCRSVR